MPRKGERMNDEQRARIAASLTKPPPTYKRCPRCKRRRRASSFRTRPDGRTLASYCVKCERAYAAERQRRYWEAHPEHRPRQRQHNRRATLKRYHGITPEQYDEMLAIQGGKCAICAASAAGRGHANLPLDHDHETGAVRGILCHRCNRALGLLGDSAELLERARAYLVEPPLAHLTSQVRP